MAGRERRAWVVFTMNGQPKNALRMRATVFLVMKVTGHFSLGLCQRVFIQFQ